MPLSPGEGLVVSARGDGLGGVPSSESAMVKPLLGKALRQHSSARPPASSQATIRVAARPATELVYTTEDCLSGESNPCDAKTETRVAIFTLNALADLSPAAVREITPAVPNGRRVRAGGARSTSAPDRQVANQASAAATGGGSLSCERANAQGGHVVTAGLAARFRHPPRAVGRCSLAPSTARSTRRSRRQRPRQATARRQPASRSCGPYRGPD